MKLFLDAIDEAACREGAAVREFKREYATTHYKTRAQVKRGVVRGNLGAKQRKGLIRVTPIVA